MSGTMVTNSTKFNLYFDVDILTSTGVKVYIPEPSQLEIKGISRILGYFFKVISEQRESAVVVVADWERLVDESLDGLSLGLKEQVRKNLDDFFTRRLNACSVIDDGVVFDYASDGIKKYLDDPVFVDRLKGNCLFISALLRYLQGGQTMGILTDFTSSLSITELTSSLKKSSKDVAHEAQP